MMHSLYTYTCMWHAGTSTEKDQKKSDSEMFFLISVDSLSESRPPTPRLTRSRSKTSVTSKY